MLQLFMIILGTIAVAKGEFNLMGSRKVYEPHGKMLGGFLLLAGLFGFIPTFGRLFAILFFYAAMYVGFKYSKLSTKEKNEYVSLKDEMAQRQAKTDDRQ